MHGLVKLGIGTCSFCLAAKRAANKTQIVNDENETSSIARKLLEQVFHDN